MTKFQQQVIGRSVVSLNRYIYIGPGDLGSIPGGVIPKTLKMVLGTSLLKT